MTGRAPVYIISTGRAGTTFVARLLSAGDDRAMSHQLPGSRALNIIGNVVIAGRLSGDQGWKLAARLGFDGSSTADPLRSMIIAAGLQSGRLRHAKVVHVVRDPRAFTTSFMNWKQASVKRRFLHHVVPAWQPNPWLVGEASLSAWMAMPKFEHFCWIWNYKNRLFGTLGEFAEYRRFRFEDLVAPGSGELSRLAAFAGMDIADAPAETRVNASVGGFPGWRHWDAVRSTCLARHCGALMNDYAYGLEPEWQLKAGTQRRAATAATAD